MLLSSVHLISDLYMRFRYKTIYSSHITREVIYIYQKDNDEKICFLLLLASPLYTALSLGSNFKDINEKK